MYRPVIANLKRLFVWGVAVGLSATAVGTVQLKGSGRTLREVAVSIL